jgi:hypothetical protein
MDHRKLRESETQYERAMNRDIKECDNHMKKEKEKNNRNTKEFLLNIKQEKATVFNVSLGTFLNRF